jgi:hypothetical protein
MVHNRTSVLLFSYLLFLLLESIGGSEWVTLRLGMVFCGLRRMSIPSVRTTTSKHCAIATTRRGMACDFRRQSRGSTDEPLVPAPIQCITAITSAAAHVQTAEGCPPAISAIPSSRLGQSAPTPAPTLDRLNRVLVRKQQTILRHRHFSLKTRQFVDCRC